MSVGALVGLALIALATAVWARGAVVLVRANPDQRVPRMGNQRYGRYQGAFFIGFVVGLLGCSQLKDAYGWWGYLIGYPVFALPPVIIAAMHNRRLAQRAPPR